MVMFVNGPEIPVTSSEVSVKLEHAIGSDGIGSQGDRYIRLKLGSYQTAKSRFLTAEAARMLRDELVELLGPPKACLECPFDGNDEQEIGRQ